MACEGCGTDSCCCGSITVQETPRVAGVSPDDIISEGGNYGADPLGMRWQIIIPSCHLLGLTISADASNVGGRPHLQWYSGIASQGWGGVTIQLFTSLDPDDTENDNKIFRISLKPGESWTLGDEYCGTFLDGGLYAEIWGVDLSDASVFREYAADGEYTQFTRGGGTIDALRRDMVCMSSVYVKRIDYPPVYMPADSVKQHYWACWNSEEFLHNFYAGASTETWDNSGQDPGEGGGGGGALSDHGYMDRPGSSFLSTLSGSTLHTYGTGEPIRTYSSD